MISPAVQTGFDNFWANKPAPDGVGIQDHYAAAWRHVAKRFANNPTVIGYDLMNEPFPGTVANEIQRALLQSRFAVLLGARMGDLAQSPEELAALWLDPDGRQKITEQFEDIAVYQALVDAQEELCQKFEREQLQPMFQRVANAIREVDRNHLLLLETGYHSNAGVRSGIEPLKIYPETTKNASHGREWQESTMDSGSAPKGADGRRDPLQAFVPHGYDIVVDTPALARANPARVELIFGRHGKTADRLAMPMIIGEWGAFGNWDERILPSARVIQRQFEQLLCGDTYWDYGRDIQNTGCFPVLRRSIPCRIAGTLLEYRSDPETDAFLCRWKETEEVTAPTVVFVTEAAFAGRSVRVEPAGAGFEMRSASADSGDVFLSIRPTGDSVQRSLTVE
jgi:endoglycosylceramidase